MGNGIPNTWDNLKTIWEVKVKMKETEMFGLKYIAVIIINIYLRNKSIFFYSIDFRRGLRKMDRNTGDGGVKN